MTSLVANYGSDNSDSDNNSASDIETIPTCLIKQTKNREQKGSNFFESVETDSEDSDYDSHGNSGGTGSSCEPVDKLPNPLLEPLPSATSSLHNQPGSSVFVSQYHIAEKEKESVLEKHVKLSETKVTSWKKVQICHKFKKGKCHYGKNCKYSHDIDNSPANSTNQTVRFDQVTDPRTGTNTIPLFHDRVKKQLPQPEYVSPLLSEREDDDSYMGKHQRKRRAGLPGSLVPSKKALSSLNKMRQSERPWTYDKTK